MKKRILALLLAVVMLLGILSGCGGDEGVSVEMLYYTSKHGPLVAACCTEQGIAAYGGGFYDIILDSATIYNTSGEECALEDLVRGCTICVTWDGEVNGGVIRAKEIRALTDTHHPAVPPESELTPIPDGSGGETVWTVPQADQIPEITVNHDGQSLTLTKLASSFTTVDDPTYIGGYPTLSGDPRYRQFRTTTLERNPEETAYIECSLEPSEIYIEAYCVDYPELGMEPVYMDENGQFPLMDATWVYVVTMVWRAETAQATAVYAFKA